MSLNEAHKAIIDEDEKTVDEIKKQGSSLKVGEMPAKQLTHHPHLKAVKQNSIMMSSKKIKAMNSIRFNINERDGRTPA